MSEDIKTETKEPLAVVLQRRVILRILLDAKSWKLRNEGKEFEEVVHKDGWRYYSSAHGIVFRKDDSTFEQMTGVLMYGIVAPLAWINTLRVRKAR
ncbi:hypothetical protein KAR91_83905 [Candidatus Pacearchaeota archaeon]|nr:hypothetical protein [Candidatus Pacearchaeota archaeon]